MKIKLFRLCLFFFISSFIVFRVTDCEARDLSEIENELKEDKEIYLTIDEASELALKYNFDIQLVKYDIWISRYDEDKSLSKFDAMLSGEIKYRNNKTKQSSSLIGTKSLDNDYNLGVKKKISTGTTFDLRMGNNRHSTDSIFSDGLTHDSSLGITINQDLGKNIFGLQDRSDVRIAQIDIENVEFTSLKKIEDGLVAFQVAYWNLILEVEKLKIAEEMLERSRQLYELHQEQLKDGLIEKPESIASEANYEKRKNEFALAQNAVDEKLSIIYLLLDIKSQDLAIKPTENFQLPIHSENLEKSLVLAFENRRDYLTLKNMLVKKDIVIDMKKNSTWPEINLEASLSRNGLGGGFTKAVQQITEEDNSNFFAGLSFTFPLGNRQAEAEFEQAKLEKEKEILNLKYLERKIILGVNDQIRNCNVYFKVAENGKRVANLQEKKLMEEEKKFQRGRSDTDTLIRFQEDVIQSRLESVIAIHRYHIAVVQLRSNEGSILNKYWKGKI